MRNLMDVLMNRYLPPENHNMEIQFQVLLVEDDLAYVELISRSFEIYGQYQLITKHTSYDARAVVANSSPDLIITDLRLPDGNGIFLLKQFVQEKKCPVIVISDLGDEAIAVNAMKEGAADYIVKTEKTMIELPTTANRVLREWLHIMDKKIALEQQNRLTAIMDATPDLICIADNDGFLTYLNDAGYRMLDLPLDEEISIIRLAEFYAPLDDLLISTKGMPYAIKHGTWKSEVTFISKLNEKILTSLVLIAHKSEQGDIDFFSTVARDIRNLRSAEEQIEYLAYYDALTGLPNRNELLRRLDDEIDRVQRHKVKSALLFIDLDDFKYVNNSLDRPTSDLVLKEVANRLKSAIRGEDTLARLGGDEFVVILTGLSANSLEAINQAREVTKKLIQHIVMDMHIGGMSFNLTASIGISMFSADTESSHELLRFADTAMYQAKKSGKNQYEIFHNEMSVHFHHQLELEHSLRKAYSNNEYVLFYQPRINTLTGNIHGAEVLLHWNDPNCGITAPGSFMDILESSGLIIDVGQWVLEESLKQLAIWIAEGIWNTQHRLGVNISARQFQNEQFLNAVINLLDKTKVPAQCIDLEITEYSVISDVDNAITKMKELISKGITFSLDDFGTGYSSLSYLKNLPISTVKIDKSFICDITENKSDEALVTSIITISKNLGLSVVAEGIETRAQMQLLMQNQCEYLQGPYFNKPLPATEFAMLMH